MDNFLSLMQHLEEEKKKKLTSLQIPLFERVHLQIFHYPLRLLELHLIDARREVKEINACQRNGQDVALKLVMTL